MMSSPVIVHGTIKPDGTLELNRQPNLPPGPVLVTVQQVPSSTSAQRGLADVIDAIRQSQQARGFQERSAQEIEAGLREGEDDYEQRMQTLRSQSRSGPLAGGS
jgi:hypothetical protein